MLLENLHQADATGEQDQCLSLNLEFKWNIQHSFAQI